MDKVLILNKIKSHYGFKSNVEFAHHLDIKPQVLSNWYSRGTFDIDVLYTKCVGINSDWLLTGEGNIMGDHPYEQNQSIVSEPGTPYKKNTIPLIPIEAMAGAGVGEMQVLDNGDEKYVVPIFKGSDFLIKVRGNSMYPKYNSGDIVACKKLVIDTFFQWNKVYVLDTCQGALVKRVRKSESEDHITLFSDNVDYTPFEIHKKEINALALVMGVIRLE